MIHKQNQHHDPLTENNGKKSQVKGFSFCCESLSVKKHVP